MEKGRIVSHKDLIGGMKVATMEYPGGNKSVTCMNGPELDWKLWCQRMLEEGKLSEDDMAELKGILIDLYGKFI